MAFRSRNLYSNRFYFESGQTQVFRPARGNLYNGMVLDINLNVSILTTACANIPSFQIARAIQKLEVRTSDGNVKWSISGEGLAAKFLYRRGVEAKGNAGIAVAVANNVVGRMTLFCPFSPDDAARPKDYMMDTRGAQYEIAITWRDLTAAGTLFGTIGDTVTAAQASNYIDLELQKVDLIVGPDGKADAYANTKPFMRGLRESIEDITATTSGFLIQPSKLKQYRGATIWTTTEANALCETGSNAILTDKVILQDTQNNVYDSVKASTLHALTSQGRGVGSGFPDGIYDLSNTRFGNATDELVADNVVELSYLLDVAKLANKTSVRMIYDTTETQ